MGPRKHYKVFEIARAASEIGTSTQGRPEKTQFRLKLRIGNQPLFVKQQGTDPLDKHVSVPLNAEFASWCSELTPQSAKHAKPSQESQGSLAVERASYA